MLKIALTEDLEDYCNNMENAKDSRQMTEEERVRKKTCQNHNKFELVKLFFFLKFVNFYHYCFNKFFLPLIDL